MPTRLLARVREGRVRQLKGTPMKASLPRRMTLHAIEAAVLRHEPLEALRLIALLRPALDAFFEEVMVMSEERALRDNRLALLQSIAALFLTTEVVIAEKPEKTPPPVPGGDHGGMDF